MPTSKPTPNPTPYRKLSPREQAERRKATDAMKPSPAKYARLVREGRA